MRPALLACLLLATLDLLGQAAPLQAFRQWLGGQEVGGSTQEVRQDGSVLEARSREWMAISRLGQDIRQEVAQTARKAPDGSLAFTWRLQLSAEPFEGRAEWTPLRPGILSVHAAHGVATEEKAIPPGAILWPEDLDNRLKEAASGRRAIRVTTFSFPIQQWSSLHLEPKGPDPLPGFPDAVRFAGEEVEGATTAPVEVWISPTGGELRHRTQLGGLEVISQRAELPPPTPAKPAKEGFFEGTLQPLPPHPFLAWLDDLTLRAEGALPGLPEDTQQVRLAQGRWHLRQASWPTQREAAQPPVTGHPTALEARYLAPSPLVPFQDPAFDGLLQRMALPHGLSRWDLGRRVTRFVFEWITEKDFSVGFASALEVCHHPRGDCTEHGVLAVALLRRLGVPARGVTGWVGLGDMLGLHFWVEIHLQDRWVPLDPTFDQAPASACRIKLGETDLADLGSIGWEGAAQAFSGVKWVPERCGNRPWGSDISLQGDQVSAPGGIHLRLPGGAWSLDHGALSLRTARGNTWRIQATPRPSEGELRGAQALAGPRTLRRGWLASAPDRLWMKVDSDHWLRIEGASDAEAYDLLDRLRVRVREGTSSEAP
jgi:hypothetical protein